MAILVTEPTRFGLHDLSLAVKLVKDMGIPMGIIINRSDEYDHLIEKFAAEEEIEIWGRIPFSRELARQYSIGALMTDNPDVPKALQVISQRIWTCGKELAHAVGGH